MVRVLVMLGGDDVEPVAGECGGEVVDPAAWCVSGELGSWGAGTGTGTEARRRF
jgi:hypothetical protein